MTTEVEPQSEPKKRSSGPAVIGTILVSLVVVFIALWAVDNWARQQVADYVTEKVQEVLSLESDEPVSVQIAGASVIAQVITGSLEQVSVDVDSVTIGELTGGVSLTAQGVPIDLSQPVDRVQIEFRVNESSLTSIAHALSANTIETVEIVDEEIRFTSQFSIFGFSLDVGVGVVPFAEEGEIGFTPTSIALNGSRSSADELIERFGSVAESLFATQSVCVAEWLPAVLSVDEVTIRDEELVVTIGARNAVLDEAAVSTLGTCAS